LLLSEFNEQSLGLSTSLEVKLQAYVLQTALLLELLRKFKFYYDLLVVHHAHLRLHGGALLGERLGGLLAEVPVRNHGGLATLLVMRRSAQFCLLVHHGLRYLLVEAAFLKHWRLAPLFEVVVALRNGVILLVVHKHGAAHPVVRQRLRPVVALQV